MPEDLATGDASDARPSTAAGDPLPARPVTSCSTRSAVAAWASSTARDTALGRDVAVKLLADRYPADWSAAQRFLIEARITSQLQHPGIPAVHQVGTLPDGRPFLAMKLIKGHTLEAVLNTRDDATTDHGQLVTAFEAVLLC